MSSIVIAEMKNASDADLLVKLVEKVNGKAKILKGKELEDFYFANLIDEGMKTKNVPLSKLRSKLRR